MPSLDMKTKLLLTLLLGLSPCLLPLPLASFLAPCSLGLASCSLSGSRGLVRGVEKVLPPGWGLLPLATWRILSG